MCVDLENGYNDTLVKLLCKGPNTKTYKYWQVNCALSANYVQIKSHDKLECCHMIDKMATTVGSVVVLPAVILLLFLCTVTQSKPGK